MNTIEFVVDAGTVIALVSMGYGMGRWHARQQRKHSMLLSGVRAAKDVLGQVQLVGVRASPEVLERGDKLSLEYTIQSKRDIPEGIWLGANLRDEQDHRISDHNEDKSVVLRQGERTYSRVLSIPMSTRPGLYKLLTEVWFGATAESAASIALQQRHPTTTIKIK